MYLILDKDFSTYCFSETRPLVYKQKLFLELQLKQIIIFLRNYAHEFSYAMSTKVSLIFCFVLLVQRKGENMIF